MPLGLTGVPEGDEHQEHPGWLDLSGIKDDSFR